MMCRWDQDIIGYHFTIFHCSVRMMIFVDDFTQRFSSITVQHVSIVALLYRIDASKYPLIYERNIKYDEYIIR